MGSRRSDKSHLSFRHADEPRDLAQIRFDNAMALFDDFVRATIKHPTPPPCAGSTAVSPSDC